MVRVAVRTGIVSRAWLRRKRRRERRYDMDWHRRIAIPVWRRSRVTERMAWILFVEWLFHRFGFRAKRGMLRPLSPPMDDNTTNTESAGVLGRIVLYDALKTKSLVVSLTPIAVKKFFAMVLGVRFDFGVEDPFHILQGELLSERPFWRVDRRFLSSSPQRCSILCNLGIETSSDKQKNIDGKLRTAVFRQLFCFLPFITDGLVCKKCDSSTQRCLLFLPLFIDKVPCFFCRGQSHFQVGTVSGTWSSLAPYLLFPYSLLSICTLSK